VKEKKTP
jgi:hypothetical protein